jgi:hypothetical protein
VILSLSFRFEHLGIFIVLPVDIYVYSVFSFFFAFLPMTFQDRVQWWALRAVVINHWVP